MEEELKIFMLRSGVKESTVERLVIEELDTEDDLNSASEELLKQCGISGGQVLKIKVAISKFLEEKAKEVLDKSGQLPESPLSCTSTSSQLSSPLSSPSPETSSSSSATCSSYKSSPATSTPTHNKKPAFSHFDLLTSTTPGSSTSGTSWIVNYHLPLSFSPAVTKALAEKKVVGARRNELTRDICSSIRVHTLYPTKAEREHVACLLIKKFPFLEDAIGSGIGSWETAFKNRFKNLRKTGIKREGVEKKAEEKDDLPVVKKRKIDEIPCMPEGETKETSRRAQVDNEKRDGSFI
ncbi:unnamed protein product [Porites lobata]|uniref:Uncharacterized protein n=1 Tax=Porites lobata TaxID=104759 RepID=A0ABN8RKD5_9CNID|nr:unnamed protein product [Porites lobata]